MDLETAKLVAFALWAEAYEGTTGKHPATIKDQFAVCQAQPSFEALHDLLGEDLAFKLDNYLTVWEAGVEEAPPPTEPGEVEAGEGSKVPLGETEPGSEAEFEGMKGVFKGAIDKLDKSKKKPK